MSDQEVLILKNQGVVQTVPAEAVKIVAVDLLNALAPLLDLPEDCTGITLRIDIGSVPELEVRRIINRVPAKSVQT